MVARSCSSVACVLSCCQASHLFSAVDGRFAWCSQLSSAELCKRPPDPPPDPPDPGCHPTLWLVTGVMLRFKNTTELVSGCSSVYSAQHLDRQFCPLASIRDSPERWQQPHSLGPQASGDSEIRDMLHCCDALEGSSRRLSDQSSKVLRLVSNCCMLQKQPMRHSATSVRKTESSPWSVRRSAEICHALPWQWQCCAIVRVGLIAVCSRCSGNLFAWLWVALRMNDPSLDDGEERTRLTEKSHSIEDLLRALEKHRAECEQAGRYEEAELARLRLDQLRQHEERSRRDALMEQQHRAPESPLARGVSVAFSPIAKGRGRLPPPHPAAGADRHY
ncbi:unnamed protein product [Symbiodinium sp. CCMP2592]|nr:unnamed protein product [Symbiodinium sp. CCMP2592]